MSHITIFKQVFNDVQVKMNNMSKHIRSDKLEEWEEGTFHMYFSGTGWLQHYNTALFVDRQHISKFKSDVLKHCFKIIFGVGIKEIEAELYPQLQIVSTIWQSEVLYEAWLRRVFNFWLKGEHKAIRVNRQTFNKFVKKFNYDPTKIKKGTQLSAALESAMRAGAKEAKELTYHLKMHDVVKSDVLMAAVDKSKKPPTIKASKVAKKARRAAKVASRVDTYVPSTKTLTEILSDMGDIAQSKEVEMVTKFLLDLDHIYLRYKHIHNPTTMMAFVVSLVVRANDYWKSSLDAAQMATAVAFIAQSFKELISDFNKPADVDQPIWEALDRDFVSFMHEYNFRSSYQQMYYHARALAEPNMPFVLESSKEKWRAFREPRVTERMFMNSMLKYQWGRNRPVGDLSAHLDSTYWDDDEDIIGFNAYIYNETKDTYKESSLAEIFEKFKSIMNDSKFADELMKFTTSSTLATLAFSLAGTFDARPKLQEFIRKVGLLSAGATAVATVSQIVKLFTGDVLPFIMGQKDGLDVNSAKINTELMARLAAVVNSYSYDNRCKFVEYYCQQYNIALIDSRDETSVLAMEKLIYSELKTFVYSLPDQNLTVVTAYRNLLGRWAFSLGQKMSIAGYRPQTINVLIHGAAGIGKTVFARTVDAVLAWVYDVPKEEDPEGYLRRRIAALIMETTDNYPFEHLTEIDFGLFFDDIGTTKPEQERQAVFIMFMIQASGVRATYSKADVATKGKVLINNKYSVLTSNFRDCNIKGRITNIDAFLRRITVAVEPICSRMCIKCDSILDKCKCETPKQILNYTKFIVEYQQYPDTVYKFVEYVQGFEQPITKDCEYCKQYACKLCLSERLRKEVLLGISEYARAYKEYQLANLNKSLKESALCPVCDAPKATCECSEHIITPDTTMNIFKFKSLPGIILSTIAEDLLPLALPFPAACAAYGVRFVWELFRERKKVFYDFTYLYAHVLLLAASLAQHWVNIAAIFSVPCHLIWNLLTRFGPSDIAMLGAYFVNGEFNAMFNYIFSKREAAWRNLRTTDTRLVAIEMLQIGLATATTLAAMWYFFPKDTAVETTMNDPITDETKQARSKVEDLLDLNTPQGDRTGQCGESLSDWQANRVTHVYRNSNGTIPSYVTTTLDVQIDVKREGKALYGEVAKATYVAGNVIISRHIFDRYIREFADEMSIKVIHKGTVQFSYVYTNSYESKAFIRRFKDTSIDMVYFPANLNVRPSQYEFNFEPQAGDKFMIHTQQQGTIIGKMTQMYVNGSLANFTHPTYVIKIPGQAGFSGAPVFLISRKTNIMPVLVGVVGGYRQTDQNIIFQTLPELDFTPHKMIESSDVRFFFDDMYGLKLEDKSHHNSILTHIESPIPGGEYVGSLKNRLSNQKTNLKPTKYTKIVEELMPDIKQFEPAPLRPRMKGKTYVNDKAGKVKVQTTAKMIVQQKPLFDAVDIIVEHYKSLMNLDNLAPYTLQQAIAGIPGVFNPINRATSCGAFIPGLKEDYIQGTIDDYTFNDVILKKLEKAIEFIDKHGYYVITTDMSLKDELTKITKIDSGLCRGFNGTDLISVILLRMYLGPFYAEMMRIRNQSFAQVGINATGKEFKEMIDQMCESMGRLFSDKAFMDGDYKYFDNLLNVLYFSMKVIYDVMQSAPYYKNPQNKQNLLRLRVLVSAQIRYVQIIDCDVIIMDVSMPSGTVGTAFINCISEGIYEIVIYCIAESIDEKDINFDLVVHANRRHPFFKNLALKNFGDDNHKMVSLKAEKFYVHDNIMKGAKFLGVELTPAQKDKEKLELMHIQDTSFLKRTPSEHPVLGWVGKLEEMSIAKSLYYTDSTSEFWEEQVIPVAFRELALHGEETYKKWQQRIPYNKSYDETVNVIFSKPLWYTDTIPDLDIDSYIPSSHVFNNVDDLEQADQLWSVENVAETFLAAAASSQIKFVSDNIEVAGKVGKQVPYIKHRDKYRSTLERFASFTKDFKDGQMVAFEGHRIIGCGSWPSVALPPGSYILSNLNDTSESINWYYGKHPINYKQSGPVRKADDMRVMYMGYPHSGLRAKIIWFDNGGVVRVRLCYIYNNFNDTDVPDYLQVPESFKEAGMKEGFDLYIIRDHLYNTPSLVGEFKPILEHTISTCDARLKHIRKQQDEIQKEVKLINTQATNNSDIYPTLTSEQQAVIRNEMHVLQKKVSFLKFKHESLSHEFDFFYPFQINLLAMQAKKSEPTLQKRA